MTTTVRPHQACGLVRTDRYQDRLVSLVLPDKYTPLMLEAAILVAIARAIQPRTVFEFGTYLGIQTLTFAENLPETTRFWTLDLDESAAALAAQHEADRPLTEHSLASRARLAFHGTRHAARVTQLLGDSNLFDPAPYAGKMDFVFVDGGHDRRTLAADTRSALAMLSADHPAAIIWHDYGNPVYPEVQEFLDAEPFAGELYHVGGTLVAFLLRNVPEELRARLRA